MIIIIRDLRNIHQDGAQLAPILSDHAGSPPLLCHHYWHNHAPNEHYLIISGRNGGERAAHSNWPRSHSPACSCQMLLIYDQQSFNSNDQQLLCMIADHYYWLLPACSSSNKLGEIGRPGRWGCCRRCSWGCWSPRCSAAPWSGCRWWRCTPRPWSQSSRSWWQPTGQPKTRWANLEY